MPALLSKSLLKAALGIAASRQGAFFNVLLKRPFCERKMIIKTSRYDWDRIKDMLWFYSALGIIPLFGITAFFEIFIGPCELTDIPEGYEPKWWEYEDHPLTQLFAKYIWANPQKEYEKWLYVLDWHTKGQLYRNLEKRARNVMMQRQDYKAWYYVPYSARWVTHTAWIQNQRMDEFRHNQEGHEAMNMRPLREHSVRAGKSILP